MSSSSARSINSEDKWSSLKSESKESESKEELKESDYIPLNSNVSEEKDNIRESIRKRLQEQKIENKEFSSEPAKRIGKYFSHFDLELEEINAYILMDFSKRFLIEILMNKKLGESKNYLNSHPGG